MNADLIAEIQNNAVVIEGEDGGHYLHFNGKTARLKKRHSKQIRHIQKLAETVESRFSQYKFLDDSTQPDNEIITWGNRRDLITKSRRSAVFDTPIIRGVNALIAWMFSDLTGLENLTTNDALDDVLSGIIANGDMLGEYVGLLENAKRFWLTDGGLAVRLIAQKSTPPTIVPVRQEILELDFNNIVCNPSNTDQRWLWLRKFKAKGSDQYTYIYYPDAKFYPSPALRRDLEKEVKKSSHKKSAGISGSVKIDWDKRIFYAEFNEGVPIVAPAIPYADCLALIPQLEMAKLQLLASIAAHYEVEMREDVQDVRDGLRQIAESAGDGSVDSFATVGSGAKVSTLNVNIAMLSNDSAVVNLLRWFLQNAFPALRPESWAEREAGGLGGDSNRNQAIIQDAKMRRTIMEGIYRSILECSVIWLMSEGLNIAGISLKTMQFSTDGNRTYDVNRLVYEDVIERISVSFPKH